MIFFIDFYLILILILISEICVFDTLKLWRIFFILSTFVLLISGYVYYHLWKSLRILDKHDVSGFSNTSIFHSMQQFIQTVHEMEDTILIPRLLLDLTVNDLQDTIYLEDKYNSIVKAIWPNTDLYHLYNIINQMKVEMLWSHDHMNNCHESEKDSVLIQRFKHIRNLSNTSIYSTKNTGTSSNSESDVIIENYSEMVNEDSANTIILSIKKHLHGLHFNIQKMTLAAEYLILTYQRIINHQT